MEAQEMVRGKKSRQTNRKRERENERDVEDGGRGGEFNQRAFFFLLFSVSALCIPRVDCHKPIGLL